MARASFTTPVYFFTSIRAGSGKASIVANLSIYLNSLAQKIALIDLDGDTPLKLKNTFPQSINLQTYADLGQLSRSEENRFQKNFYFTETSQISYFPAQKLADPGSLFTDTSLRDFFIQLKASFDLVIINFPAGSQHCQKTSELLSRSHLWRGSRPISLIVSQSDEKSLVALDKMLQQNPAFSYQLQENTCLIFNRVPAAPEEQHLAGNTLSGQELRQIFDQPNSYLIPVCEEFVLQRHQSGATVLKSDSLMHQTISGLNRLLVHNGDNPLKQLSARPNNYQACLDGELLEKLTPYLEKIQLAAAARLFVHPSELQVFLEEGPENFRIRLRISGVNQPLLGINTRIRQEPLCLVVERRSPDAFAQTGLTDENSPVVPSSRATITAIGMRPVYKFPDNFSCQADARLHPQLDLLPEKSPQPSPILFKQQLDLPEVPSLSHVLGFTRRQYRQFQFTPLDKYLVTGSVTHFFLPPEFDLSWSATPFFDEIFACNLAACQRGFLNHQIVFSLTYQWPDLRNAGAPLLFDIFARHQSLYLPSSNQIRETIPPPADFASARRRFTGSLLESSIWPVPLRFLARQPAALLLKNAELIDIMPLWGAEPQSQPEPQENRENQLSIHVSQAYESFSLDISLPRPFFVEPTGKLPTIPMQSCVFFSLNAREQIGAPVAPTLSENFSRALRESPAQLDFMQQCFNKREEGIAPPDARIPEAFKWEDLLMEHVYQDVKQIFTGRSFFINPVKAFFSFKPAHPLFFRLAFNGFRQDVINSGLPFAKADVKLSFRSPAAALKVVAFKFSAGPARLIDDLLPVKYRPQKDLGHRDAADQTVYKSDRVIDSAIKNRRLAASKGRMLQINIQIGNQPAFSGKKAAQRLKTTTTTMKFAPMVLLNRALNTTNIARECQLDHLPADLFANYKPLPAILASKAFSATHIRKFQTKSLFAVEPVELTTISARRDTQRFFAFPGKGISLLINYLPTITRRTFRLPSINGNRPEFTIGHDQIQLPAALPLRNRRVEFPTLNLANEKQLALKLQCDMHAIIKQSGAIQDNIREKVSQSQCPTAKVARLPIHYPLAISAQRSLRSLPLKKSTFFIRFPAIIEVFYEHLRWSLRDERLSGLAFIDHFKNQKAEGNSPSFIIRQTLRLARHIDFRERLALFNRFHKAAREIYPISNLRLRDLMNLARQTNQKFNEVNQKIRA